MDRIVRNARALALFALLPLAAGCDDPAEVAKEIAAARGECTEEKLRAGDEECVQMMERYAGMGTEAIHTYIGAVKAMNQALERMPDPQFDTAGLGHPFSRPPSEYAPQDDPAASGLAPAGAPSAYYGAPRGGLSSGADLPRGGYPEEPAGYDPRSPYPYDPRYDSMEPRGGYPAPYGRGPDDRYREWEEEYPAPRGGERGYRPDYDPRRGDWREPPARMYDPDVRDPRREDGYGAAPRAPERGRLLPPGERLRRPWLDEERGRPGAAPRNGPREWQDTVSRWEPARPRPRSPGGAPR